MPNLSKHILKGGRNGRIGETRTGHTGSVGTALSSRGYRAKGAKELQQISDRRAAEFIGQLTAHQIATVPFYARHVHIRPQPVTPMSRFSYSPLPKSSFRLVARGWILKEEVVGTEAIDSGLFLATDGLAYQCRELQRSAPYEAPDLETPFIESAVSTNLDYPKVPPLELPFASNEAAEMLALALTHYKAL